MAEPLARRPVVAGRPSSGPVNMAVGGVLVFEGGPGLSTTRSSSALQARLHLIPRYRQRLAGAGARRA